MLPKKLNSDNLKDTLVEIRFMTGIPQELTLGITFNVLTTLGFSYTPAPNQNVNISLNTNQQVQLGFGNINAGGFFIKENVRIQIINNVIIFNCLADKYVGWDNYYQIISSVIDDLFNKNIIKAFNRISIRYVSEFKNIDILQNIQGSVQVSQTGLKLENSILRLVDESMNIKTFVTLTNRAKRRSEKQEIIEASLVDINVFENFTPEISDMKLFNEKLNAIHSKQKRVFFNLITKEFINTLEPEY